MTDEPMTPGAEDRDVTAAELALGLLDGEEKSAATRRLLAEPDFAHAVERWRAHFGTLVPAIPEVEAPANGLARLEAAIGVAPPLAGSPVAANDNRALAFWRGAAGLSGLIAAALVLAITLRPPAPPPAPNVIIQQSPVLVASIAPPKGPPVAAVYYPDRDELRIAAATLTDTGHSAELWVIPADGTPQSLGVLGAGRNNVVALRGADARRLIAGATLAVTAEQVGGSPDGKPHGPVVAAGPLQTI